MMTEAADNRVPGEETADSVLAAILRELDGIRFGQVTVTVQDGHVVQIERVERRRLKDSQDKPDQSQGN
jgi:hypothetical protein